MRFQTNTQTFMGNNEQYILQDYTDPPNERTHVAVAWIDDRGQLEMHGIAKIRREETISNKHWTQEWINESEPLTGTILSEAICNKKAFALANGSYNIKGSAGYSITDFKGNTIKGAC